MSRAARGAGLSARPRLKQVVERVPDQNEERMKDEGQFVSTVGLSN
jgi:hypothetical protein